MPDPRNPNTPDLQRYARQMLLPGFGVESQRALLASRVTVVGCGALGTVAAESLVRAGVGHVRIVDRDLVEHSNLQRQTLFTQRDADDAVPKSVAAADRLRLINPDVEIEPAIADLTPRNVEQLISGSRAVLDCTDNFQTRYLLNDACVKLTTPLIYGGAVGTRGMAMTILPRAGQPTDWQPTPCLRCVFPEPPAPRSSPTCDTAGVLGPVAGIVANVQASETLKVLLRRWDLTSRDLLDFDPWLNQRRRINLRSMLDPNCPCCARRNFAHLDALAADSASLCGQNAVQLPPPSANSSRPSLSDLADRLTPVVTPAKLRRTAHFVRAALETPRGERELTLFADGRAIIRGTSDPAEARALYARYVGA